MNPRHHRLGDLQLKILQVLWDRGEASVGDVHTALRKEREFAYTTIATMLRKMELRSLVAHREEGRSFLYQATVAAEEVHRSVGDHFVERLFEGSVAEAVSHLLQTREVSRQELDELTRLIQLAKRRLK